jgi:probable F420-dependent oxidoreductase
VKLGVTLPEWAEAGNELRQFVHGAEAAGLASMWSGDHLVIPAMLDARSYPYRDRFGPEVTNLFPAKSTLESVSTIAFAAGVSESLVFGLGILVLILRHPILVAKQLATVDVLSGGRLIAGLGVGWLREEMAAMGVPPAERAERFDESLQALQVLWSEKQPVSFDGRHFAFPPVFSSPRPTRPGGPPVWLGGHSERALERAAQVDGWLALELAPTEFARHNDRLTVLAHEHTREARSVERAVMCRLRLHDAKARAESARTIDGYRRAGCDHLILLTSPNRSLAEHGERITHFVTIAGHG